MSRGLPGLRGPLATFYRDVPGTDAEGNYSGTSETIWEGRGAFIRGVQGESFEDTAGHAFTAQHAVFRCRPSAELKVGDYCRLLGQNWSVESRENTVDGVRLGILTPPAQPLS